MMKAVVLTSNNKLEYKDVPIPVYGSDEVLVKVAYCGICGSDIPRVFDNAARSFPLILGHELSGTVESTGREVKDLYVGDTVTVAPLIPCFKCEDCKHGNYSLCDNYSFIGSRRNGAFAEFITVPAENVIKVSKNIPLEQVATIEPATVAYHAFNLVGDVKGKNIAVLGCGIIGLFAVQIANLLEAKSVTAIGRREAGLIQAEKLGATQCFSTLNKTSEEIKKEMKLNGFDIIIECSGSNTTIHNSLELVAKKGVVCFIGTPKNGLNFTVKEWEQINRKECFVTGSWMSYSNPFPGKEWSDAVKHMETRKIQGIIDRIYNFSEVRQAFDDIRAGKTCGRVILKNQNFL